MTPNPTSAEIATRVCRVIAETQKLPVESVTPDKTFEELKIDSLDGINILFAVEGEFDVDIPDGAAREIRSIPDMVQGIEQLLAAKAPAVAAPAPAAGNSGNAGASPDSGPAPDGSDSVDSAASGDGP
jgi:acyl carrier protein